MLRFVLSRLADHCRGERCEALTNSAFRRRVRRNGFSPGTRGRSLEGVVPIISIVGIVSIFAVCQSLFSIQRRKATDIQTYGRWGPSTRSTMDKRFASLADTLGGRFLLKGGKESMCLCSSLHARKLEAAGLC